MSDFLLELGQNPRARQLIQGLGLPVPMPQELRRARGPRGVRDLRDELVVVGAAPDGALGRALARTLTIAGAEPALADGATGLRGPFEELGEAYGRRPSSLDLQALPEKFSPRGMVFDATGIADTAGLRALYDFFHPIVRSLAKCGRIVVLGRPADQASDPEQAAVRNALDGFVRSIAKEVGKKGSTANLLVVDPGAEDRVDGPLRFLLTPRSAFVSGQPLRISTRARAEGFPLDDEAWQKPLEGKVALVTGAARGIGAATAKVLAGEGAHVLCLDRPADDTLLSKVAREVGGTPVLADVTDLHATQAIIDAAKAQGGLDIVIHNAGVTRDKTMAKMKPEQWDLALEINLAAIARITEALVAGPMRDGGRIVCLSSVAGIAGNMGQTNYAASKAGVVGYVRAQSARLADRGITVNAIAPGFIETRLTDAIPVMIREAGRRLSNLGQGGQPVDVGEALTFLSTPGAAGVTGNVLRVCGGALIGA